MKKVLVISAHLDDAVLSAGQFIAGRNGNVDVLTVFSGIPMEENLLTDYDKSCGFNSSKDAVVVRRQEDIEACAMLNAQPLHTDLLDSQYKNSKGHNKIENLLYDTEQSKDYELILAPIGLRHPDHEAVTYASIVALQGSGRLYLYEDIPHRVTHPELVFENLQKLRQLFNPTLTFIGDGNIADKMRALMCYKSQMLRGDLNPYNLYVPERFWKV